MTVFYDRRSAAYKELSGDSADVLITGIPGQNNADTYGFSGGKIPPLSNTQEQYPINLLGAVINMR